MVTGRQVLWAVGFTALGAAVALGVNAVADSDPGGGPASAPTGMPTPLEIPSPVPPDPDENPEAAEFFDIVSSFQTLELHATYRITLSARPGDASEVEIWQKDGQFRQEADAQSADGSAQARIVLLSLTDRTVYCEQPPDGEWVCGLLPESTQTTFSSLRSGLLTGLGEQEVTVRDDDIDGREVRCFVVEPAEDVDATEAPSEPSELCATPEGVLVTISGPEGTFELLELETAVDDAVFTPPATPGVGPGDDAPVGPPAPA